MTKDLSLNPLHLCARSNNRDWFQAPLEECWQIFKENLSEAEKRFGFRTHAFVMMSNHYHWLMSPAEQNLGVGMCYFQTTTSRQIARAANRINRIYGARYKSTEIFEPEHFKRTIRYIYQNPVRSKICPGVELYPFSSLADRTIKLSKCEGYDALLPSKNFIDWLNTEEDAEMNERIRKALRRQVFRLPRDGNKYRKI